jgi:hypothetical protein
MYVIAVAKSFFLPPLTLTLSPAGGRGDKRKKLLGCHINSFKICASGPTKTLPSLSWGIFSQMMEKSPSGRWPGNQPKPEQWFFSIVISAGAANAG